MARTSWTCGDCGKNCPAKVDWCPHCAEEVKKANKTQIGGTHWTNKPIQCWDYIAANSIGYFEGNVIKYVTRWREKGGVDDLKKARHYIDKLIELQEAVPSR